MNEELRALCQTIGPATLQGYLLSRRWALKEDPFSPVFAVYERNGVMVDVPLHPEYADYSRRVGEVIELVAQTEGVGILVLTATLISRSTALTPGVT